MGEAIFFALGCGMAVIGCLLSFWLGREHAYSDSLTIYRRALTEDGQSVSKTMEVFCGDGSSDVLLGK